MPPIDIGTERYEFTIDLRMAHMLSKEDRVWLSMIGESWSEAEQLALVTAKHEGDIDNPRLRRLTGLHLYDATKILGSLRDRLFLTMSRVGRATLYQLGPKATMVVTESNSSSNSSSNDVSSGSNDISYTNSDANLKLWAELEEISKPSRLQMRLNAKDRDKLILELCAHAPLSLSELARLMGRTNEALRNAVQQLLANENLKYLYPNQPTHRYQKCITIRYTVDDRK